MSDNMDIAWVDRAERQKEPSEGKPVTRSHLFSPPPRQQRENAVHIAVEDLYTEWTEHGMCLECDCPIAREVQALMVAYDKSLG